MRRVGWISLFIVVLIAACGPPTVTNLDSNGNPGGDSDDDDGTPGDDDDDGSSSPTPSGSAAPTLTNVPSFATWDAQIRAIGCSECHSAGSGGFYSNPSESQNKKFFWFSAICNRTATPGQPGAGTASYDPPLGRFRAFYCNMGFDLNNDGVVMGEEETHSQRAINDACDTIDSWFLQGAGTTPPNCDDFYDLENSS